jgi:Flp pilus assembly protein CpaB
VRRSVLAHRRALAALCAALAVLVVVRGNTAPAPARVPVLVATHDIGGGQHLDGSDVRVVGYAPGTAPSGRVGDVVGRVTSGPLTAGEPFTDARLLGGSLLRGYRGLVAAPVRIADAQSVGLLRAGDLIDVLAADPEGRQAATTVAASVPVLALPKGGGGGVGDITGGRLVVVAVSRTIASELAAAGVTQVLSVLLTS